MKKVLSVLLIVVLFTTILVGCTDTEEFTTYVNETSYDIFQDEGDIIKKLNPNGTNSEIITALKEDVLPGYEDLIEEAKGLTFENGKIDNLNSIAVEYLEAKLTMYESYLGVYTATTESEAVEYSEKMSAAVEKGNELLEKFEDEKQKLADELGVELENK